MDFFLRGRETTPLLRRVAAGIEETLVGLGHRTVTNPAEAGVVLNFTVALEARAVHRLSEEVFVVTVAEFFTQADVGLESLYPILIRSLSNLLVALVDDGESTPTAHFVTPEQGHSVAKDAATEEAFYREIANRILPLVHCTPIRETLHHQDLPQELWGGDEVTRAIARAGKKLDALGLLPPRRSLDEFLPHGRREGARLPYGEVGLSYGNLSGRFDEERFWMTASGVDKGKLGQVGHDLLLVKGYDPGRRAMVVSIPRGAEPRPVSVDAVEHWMIYQENPEVRAIIHVHAWMDGVSSTEVAFPCGTLEMAAAVAELVQVAPDPAVAAVGLKNHGITIVGQSMDEILGRVEGRLFRPVPMS